MTEGADCQLNVLRQHQQHQLLHWDCNVPCRAISILDGLLSIKMILKMILPCLAIFMILTTLVRISLAKPESRASFSFLMRSFQVNSTSAIVVSEARHKGLSPLAPQTQNTTSSPQFHYTLSCTETPTRTRLNLSCTKDKNSTTALNLYIYIYVCVHNMNLNESLNSDLAGWQP